MASEPIRSAIEAAIGYLREHPDDARYTDSVAVATLEQGLRFRVAGPGGESTVTDMSPSVGGGGSAPSPGWLFRAALASCVATLIAMRASLVGMELDGLKVTVDSESDDRGILGIDEATPAGPLSIRVRVDLQAAGASPESLREVAEWGAAHCPVCDAAKRIVPVTLEVGTG